jgi:hypothetical protein
MNNQDEIVTSSSCVKNEKRHNANYCVDAMVH